jgi:16S rRNA (cytosine1402-N4)-methyltransferase
MRRCSRSSRSWWRALTVLIDMSTPHVPVLAEELLQVMAPQPDEVAVDCTVGAAGHARMVAERLGYGGTLIGLDRDPLAAETFAAMAAEVDCETRFIAGDFVSGLQELLDEGAEVDLIYMDLGMSSMQIDTWERGFSYSYDAPLDMRMDPSQELTAATIVNEWEEGQIVKLLREYGEERYAGQIARAISRERRRQQISSTQQLVDVIKSAIPVPAQFAGGHPAKRSFQALRVAVNDELGQLDAVLPLAWELLSVGGRLGAITFQSLEDRRVKHFFAELARGCICPPEFPICVCGHEPEAELITRRPISPGTEEMESNPRSKSAHLRVARKIKEQY